MAKIVVFYKKTDQQEEFENYYFHVHLPLVKKIPQIQNLKISRVVWNNGTAPDIYLHGEIEFANMEALNQACESPEGKAMFEDAKMMRKFFDSPPITAFIDGVEIDS
ncbi:EthD family reductase [Neobacillus mesonae]|uniref:EthD family reductase n=1 Tax=Neobacillus mesonae TaxID=1193713 RepID=UPI00204162C8|nr:EthD family reductase [Neobacillus mesonae]MCM3567487.1 EthD family reductase [Neobacillus mesonae]